MDANEFVEEEIFDDLDDSSSLVHFGSEDEDIPMADVTGFDEAAEENQQQEAMDATAAAAAPQQVAGREEGDEVQEMEVEDFDAMSSPVRFTQTSPINTPGRFPSGSRQIAATPQSTARSRLQRLAIPTSSADFRRPGGDGDGGDASRDDEEDEAAPVIWGTTICYEKTMLKVKEFLETFPDPHTGQPLYPGILDDIRKTEDFNVNINCSYLNSFDAEIYQQLVRYPQEMIIIFDLALKEVYKARFESQDADEDAPPEPNIQVRVFNLLKVEKMRDLSPKDIDQLVSIRGMIIRASNIIPEMKQAFFQCPLCQQHVVSVLENGYCDQPSECPRCHTKGSMELVHNRCIFTDKQIIKLQETPDAIPEGEAPHTVNLVTFDTLVDVGRPGDRVEVTGVFRAQPLRSNPRRKAMKSIYKTYIDVIHFKKADKGRLASVDSRAKPGTEFHTSFQESDVVEEVRTIQDEKLRELGARPDIYELLARSIAPSIWQLEDIKKGILCQLFGGTNKDFATEEGLGRFRGEINILLCGDPGTSKSQLLSYVHKIAPRGIYTSGKGSSAVGLTAYVTKDMETGEAVLESGALVLSDRGVCCIDEFDKMSDTTRAVLHEVMEQQTVSVAKAGIICTLNARTSILASANPIESRYNPNLSVVENIQLPPTLLSRFDLIYLVLDKPNEDTDRKLAKHLVSLYWKEPHAVHDMIPLEQITAYISYAKRTCQPVITDAAGQQLVSEYLKLRKMGSSANTVSATTRQLESLIRISEAHARIRLSDTVESQDVDEAVRLVYSAMQQAAIDPRTGKIDLDLIVTGRSASSRGRLADLASELREMLLKRRGTTLKFSQVLLLMQQQSTVDIAPDELRSALQLLSEEDFLALSGDPRNQSVRVI